MSSQRRQCEHRAQAVSWPRRQWEHKAKAVSSQRRQWEHEAQAAPLSYSQKICSVEWRVPAPQMSPERWGSTRSQPTSSMYTPVPAYHTQNHSHTLSLLMRPPTHPHTHTSAQDVHKKYTRWPKLHCVLVCTHEKSHTQNHESRPSLLAERQQKREERQCLSHGHSTAQVAQCAVTRMNHGGRMRTGPRPRAHATGPGGSVRCYCKWLLHSGRRRTGGGRRARPQGGRVGVATRAGVLAAAVDRRDRAEEHRGGAEPA